MIRGPRFPRRGTPHSFGWVRVPEDDENGWLAWERPDGMTVLLHHDVGVLVQLLPMLHPEPDVEAARR